jgi:DNA-directed RNA polymerase specialized sigma24 family protein
VESTQYYNRIEFLKAIEKYASEVLWSLTEDVLPYYQSGLIGIQGESSIADYLTDVIKSEHLSDTHPFTKAICIWARKWNLTDSWLFYVALRTLYQWSRSNKNNIKWAYELPTDMVEVVPGRKNSMFNFNFPLFDARVDSWSDYEQRIKESFSDKLQTYRSRIKSQEVENKASRKYAESHYEWLIQFQIKGRSYSSIAECSRVDESTVHKPIKQLATLISLTLRPVKRGRPSLLNHC